MTARTILAAAITAAQPTWNVISTARRPERITRPTVFVWTSQYTRTLAADWLKGTLEVWLVVPETAADVLEDRLDALLVDLLAILEARGELVWTEADRDTLADTWQGWHITATTAHHIES